MRNLIGHISINSLLLLLVSIIIIRSNLPAEGLPTLPMARTLLYASGLFLFFQKNVIGRIKENSLLLICIVFLFVMLLFESQRDPAYIEHIRFWIELFVFSLIPDKCSREELELTRCFFLSFIVANCFLVFYERTYMTNVFFSDENIFGNSMRDTVTEFRASGFTGHPVLGGFITSVVLAFIQLDRTFTTKTRILLTIILIIGLLCFNSRFNIMVSFLASLYILRDELFKDEQKRTRNIIILLSLVSVFFYFMLNTSWGGRLFARDITNVSDESSWARIEAFDVFDAVQTSELWLGDLALTSRMMEVLDLAGIENGYICIILKYGILFGVPMIIVFSLFQWNALACYSKNERIVLFGIFFLIAFTNPHIAHNIPWTYWIFSYYLFKIK